MKNIFKLIFICMFPCFAENWNDCYLSEQQYFYTSYKVEYVTKKETVGLYENTSYSNIKLKENNAVKDVNYFWGTIFDEDGDMIKATRLYTLKFQNMYYLEDDFFIKNSDCLPNDILVKTTQKNNNSIWIPNFYTELLEEGSNISSIYSYLPKLKQYATETDVPWYMVNNLSFPINISFRNTRMTISYIYNSCDFIFTKLKKLNESDYEIECYPEQGIGFEDLKDIDFLKSFYQKKHVIKLTINNKRICIYEEGVKLLDLVQVSPQWVTEYQKNLRNMDEARRKELLKFLTVGEIGVQENKILITNTNLKLRSGEATSTQVLTVMSAGTKVKILELGKAETIDGISSNWVKVEVQKGAKDRDGNPIKAGTVGWCYGGYLK